jgi:uncharacterized protein YjbJ (UPF0337 family)
MPLDKLQGDLCWLRGKVREHWPLISEAELSYWSGEVDMLIGKIQEHYEVTIPEAQQQFAEFLPELHATAR